MNWSGKWRSVLALAVALVSGAASAQNYPFGARLEPYSYGTKVNHVSTQTMDVAIKGHYNTWKAARIVDAPGIAGGKAVNKDSGTLTVSEGMGYGMLIAVVMAGHDPNARALFDGLLTTVRARPAYALQPSYPAARYLMDWKLNPDGTSGGDGYNAVDGDLDIALALLMADRQWGSTGTWNYRQEALNTINAIKGWNFNTDPQSPGYGTALAQGTCCDTSRTSDYMIGHFRAFAQATGDSFWSGPAIDRAYALIDRMQTVYSSAGLMPDFIVGINTASPAPSPGNRIESATEGDYFANAERNPWRWGTDYVFSGDPRWKTVLTRLMNFFVSDNAGNPNNMSIGYHLNGGSMGHDWPARGLIAGALNGAQIDPAYQSYLNASWDWLDQHWTDAYYDAEKPLLSMMVASGNWWLPGGSVLPPQGPPSTKIQAENGTIQGSGVSVKTDLAGYEGTGFVGNFTANGDRLTVTFGNVAAGTYDVKIRYHAWTAQQNDISINGAAATSQAFPATGSAWAVKTISGVPLVAGNNSVAFIKDWGYTDVDSIEIVPTSGGLTTARTEAENGALQGSGVGVRTDLAGYEGSAFVGSFTTDGDSLTITYPGMAAGTYTVSIRYHSWNPQQNIVVVNGASSSQSFPATGNDWAVKTITGVALPAGTTTISIQKEWGWIEVDWIQISR